MTEECEDLLMGVLREIEARLNSLEVITDNLRVQLTIHEHSKKE